MFQSLFASIAFLVGFQALSATLPIKIPLIKAGKTLNCSKLTTNQCAVKAVERSPYVAQLLKSAGKTKLEIPTSVMTVSAFGDGGEIWSTHIVAIYLGESTFEKVQLFRVNMTITDDDAGTTLAHDESFMAPVELQEKIPVLGLSF